MISKNFSCVIAIALQENLLETIANKNKDAFINNIKKINTLLHHADMSGLTIYYTQFVNPITAYSEVMSESVIFGSTELLFTPKNSDMLFGASNYGLSDALLSQLKELVTKTGLPVLLVGVEADAFVLGACFSLWNAEIPFKVSGKHVISESAEAQECAFPIIVRQFMALDMEVEHLMVARSFTTNDKLVSTIGLPT